MKIKIYQIDLWCDTEHLHFLGYADFIQKQETKSIDSEIYREVFNGEVDCKDLEDVFIMFNVNIPDGFIGTSLSVSDIVEVCESYTIDPGFYFCDNIGFVPVAFNSNKCNRSDYKTDKKQNMEYWDFIDNKSEKYVKAIYALADNADEITVDDDEILSIYKEVQDTVIEKLEKLGLVYPFVDENY